jgi:hypothetical protein
MLHLRSCYIYLANINLNRQLKISYSVQGSQKIQPLSELRPKVSFHGFWYLQSGLVDLK